MVTARRKQVPQQIRRWYGDRSRRRLLKLRVLTVNEVAAFFRVSKQAVHGWIKSGRLRVWRSHRDGVRRVSRAALMRFAQNRPNKEVESHDEE